MGGQWLNDVIGSYVLDEGIGAVDIHSCIVRILILIF